MSPDNARFAFTLGLALAATGCGGGGGESQQSTDPSVSANVASIDRTQTVAEAHSQVVVRVTVANRPASSLYGGLETSGSGIAAASWVTVGNDALEMTVDLHTPGDLDPGTYSGSVRFNVCLDSTCGRHLRGSPIVIPVRLVVTRVPNVSVVANPAQINVTAVQRPRDLTRPPRQTVMLEVKPAPDVRPRYTIAYTQSSGAMAGVTGFFTQPAQMELSIDLASPNALAVGTYSEVVGISLCYTASCVNKVTLDPVLVRVNYTVEPGNGIPEPGVAPLVPSWMERLSHDVIDAEYSKALDAIVMVASYPVNALYVYDVDSRTQTQLVLDRVPTAVSVGPDGLKAAVGHDALITYVDLMQVGQPNADPTRLNVTTKVYDIVLDGRGYVHAFPAIGQWVYIHSVAVATNTEHIGFGVHRVLEHAKLHPSGDYIYGADYGQTTTDIDKFDIRSVPTTQLYNSRYNGEYEMCNDLWMSENGANIYTACGNVFTTSVLQADDLMHVGSLTPSIPYGFFVRSLSQTGLRNEIALVEEGNQECGPIFDDPPFCHSHLATYSSDSLNQTTLRSFMPLTIAGTSYPQRGMFVFHSADGTRKFVISELHGVPAPNTEFYLSGL